MLWDVLPSTKIQHFDISRNRIGNNGVDKLKLLIADNLVPLTFLDLHETKID